MRKVLTAVLGRDLSDVEDPSAMNLEEWDSLKQMAIVAAVEDEFEVRFDEELIIHLNSFTALKRALEDPGYWPFLQHKHQP